MVNKIFNHYIRRNIKVYVDNMIVKSRTTNLHLVDLVENFQILKRYNMHLKPTKYAFEVSSGNFLGFIIHEIGIDANLKIVQIILKMHLPQSIKEVQ